MGVFSTAGDELGLGFAHLALSEVALMSGRLRTAAQENKHATEHLVSAGWPQRAQANAFIDLYVRCSGDLPASMGLAESRRQLATAEGRLPRMNAWAFVCYFAALLGRSEEEQEAREHADRLQAEIDIYDAKENLVGAAVQRALL